MLKLADVLKVAAPFLAADKKPDELKAAILAADGMPGNTGEAKEIEGEREAHDARMEEDRKARDGKRAKDRKARDRGRAKDRKAADARMEEDRAARDAERDDDPEHTNDASAEMREKEAKDRKARDEKRAADRKAHDDKMSKDRTARDAKRAADRKARDEARAGASDAGMGYGETIDAAMKGEAEDESKEDREEREGEAEDEDYTEGADPSTAAHGGASKSPTVDSAEVDRRIAAAVTADRLARDALYEAKREAEPILGIVTFDSAPKVYRAALEALQVETKGIPDAALPAMLRLAKDRGKAADPTLALDSGATAAMSKAIPGYDRLR